MMCTPMLSAQERSGGSSSLEEEYISSIIYFVDCLMSLQTCDTEVKHYVLQYDHVLNDLISCKELC